jgi:hypothetical protein
VRYEPL